MNQARMLRVYVAGPISSKNPHEVLRNIGAAIDEGARLFHLGCSPMVPHLNYHFSFRYKHDNSVYYAADNVWLDVSDCVVMLPGWKHSKGSRAEVKRAKSLRIPVYYNVDSFISALRKNKVAPRHLKEGG